MKNIEIERKYKITEVIYNDILDFLSKNNVEMKIEKQNDIYFSPIHFPFFGGEIDNECLRIRVLDNKNILSYKKFIPATNDNEAHCIEDEVEINGIDKFKNILKDLRIEEAFTLKKERRKVIYKGIIEIALDKVDNLGFFIELEIINTDNLDKALDIMNEFTDKFGITDNMRNFDGYSYLLYNKGQGKLN